MGDLILRLVNYFAAFAGFIAVIMALYGLFSYFSSDNVETKEDGMRMAKYSFLALAIIAIYLFLQNSIWH